MTAKQTLWRERPEHYRVLYPPRHGGWLKAALKVLVVFAAGWLLGHYGVTK